MIKFDTASSFIASHLNSSGYSAGQIISFEGYATTGDKGAARWRSLGTVGTVSQDPLTNNSPNLSDASGNEFVLVGEGVIDLNVLGGTGVSYQNIADAAGLVYVQGLTSNPNVSDRYIIADEAGMVARANPQVGESYIVSDRANGIFDCVTVGTTANVDLPNTYNIIVSTVDATKCFVLRVGSIPDCSQFGASSTASEAVNAGAIQAAIDYLPQSTSSGNPARYTEGGGVVYLPAGEHAIDTPIRITHNVTLQGASREGTVLTASTNIDIIQIEYKYTAVAEYWIANASIRDLSINGAGVAEAGITNRVGAISNPVTSSNFRNIEITGCKVGVHFFGAWNNTFDNVDARSIDISSATEEGLFGFIFETVTSTNTYGPTGHTVTAQGGAGGFNNNVFSNCNVTYLKRCGILIQAISAAHAYANNFTGCNFEQIIKQASGMTYAPYTDASQTPEGLTSTALAWDGRSIGLHCLGRVSSLVVDDGYFERISDTGSIDGGVGVVFDDLGITFGAGASKCYLNAIKDTFFNSNVERVAHMANCDDIHLLRNNVLLSTASDMGYYLDTGSSNTYIDEKANGNINSLSPKQPSGSIAGALAINEPTIDTANATIQTGTVPAIDIYRDGSTANFSAIRFRDGTNANTFCEIGFTSNELLLNSVTRTSMRAGSATKIQCDGTTTAGQTAMLLWDVDNGTLERVTVGAADSGGTGFKVLRIPN
jgi:hypothetical protein